jgi:hypothetical protein
VSIRLIVMQGNQLVADVPGYDGPVPSEGQYIYHPDLRGPGQPGLGGGIAGCVKQVIWGIYARPRNGEEYFTAAAEPFVEVVI